MYNADFEYDKSILWRMCPGVKLTHFGTFRSTGRFDPCQAGLGAAPLRFSRMRVLTFFGGAACCPQIGNQVQRPCFCCLFNPSDPYDGLELGDFRKVEIPHLHRRHDHLKRLFPGRPHRGAKKLNIAKHLQDRLVEPEIAHRGSDPALLH